MVRSQDRTQRNEAAVLNDKTMKSDYTAVVKRDGDWWIGWIEEIPGVNAQERSREALRDSLREALREALAWNRSEALAAAGEDYEEFEIAV